MNKNKLFDRYQLLIGIIGVAALAVSMVLFVVMTIVGTKVYSPEGVLESIIYPPVLETIHTIFVIIHLLALTWFFFRAVTYKLRTKEEEQYL